MNVIGITALGTSFYLAFAFLQEKTEQRYTWALQGIQEMYQGLASGYTSGPDVMGTDRDLGLMAALTRVFPQTPNVLCQ